MIRRRPVKVSVSYSSIQDLIFKYLENVLSLSKFTKL